MKRIGLFLGSSPYGGGTFQYGSAVLEAIAALPRERYQPVVVFLQGPWAEHVRAHDAEAHALQWSWWKRAPSSLWRRSGLPIRWWRKIAFRVGPVAMELNNLRCDLWVFPSQDTWSYRVPVPALVAVHDLMHRYEREVAEVRSAGEYERRERHYSDICRWSRGVLVDSELGRQQVHESYGLDPRRIHVLPFVAPAYMYRGGSTGGRIPNLPTKYLFYPAQFWEHKNHSRLLRVMAQLTGELPDLQLVLVGGEQLGYVKVRKQAESLGLADRVHFLGYVPDDTMRDLYRGARALVMPTSFGPTNIPPLEAFAVGCPVAVSRIYAMPEQLGDAALYFDPLADDELRETIRRLWVDDQLCAELARRGRERDQRWRQPQFNGSFTEIVDRVSRGQPAAMGTRRAKPPLVSALVPSYRAAGLVHRALECLPRQTWPSWEAVVVDNASNDGTYERVLSYARSDPRIRAEQNATNIGPVRNWLRCATLARGHLAAFLFADDWWDPEFLSTAVPWLDDERVGFVLSAARVVTASTDGGILSDPTRELRPLPETGVYSTRVYLEDVYYLRQRMPVTPVCAVMRRADLVRWLGRQINDDTDVGFLRHGAGPDLQLYLQACVEYPSFAYVGEPGVYLLNHAANLSKQPETRAAYGLALAEFYDSAKPAGLDPDRVRASLWWRLRRDRQRRPRFATLGARGCVQLGLIALQRAAERWVA